MLQAVAKRNVRKFQQDDKLQRKRKRACLSLCFLYGNSNGLSWDTKRGFFMPSNRVRPLSGKTSTSLGSLRRERNVRTTGAGVSYANRVRAMRLNKQRGKRMSKMSRIKCGKSFNSKIVDILNREFDARNGGW